MSVKMILMKFSGFFFITTHSGHHQCIVTKRQHISKTIKDKFSVRFELKSSLP